jgi:hypothetical protein
MLLGSVVDIWKLEYELKIPSTMNAYAWEVGIRDFKRADPTLSSPKPCQKRATVEVV